MAYLALVGGFDLGSPLSHLRRTAALIALLGVKLLL
jgi:hypothetical protein